MVEIYFTIFYASISSEFSSYFCFQPWPSFACKYLRLLYTFLYQIPYWWGTILFLNRPWIYVLNMVGRAELTQVLEPQKPPNVRVWLVWKHRIFRIFFCYIYFMTFTFKAITQTDHIMLELGTHYYICSWLNHSNKAHVQKSGQFCPRSDSDITHSKHYLQAFKDKLRRSNGTAGRVCNYLFLSHTKVHCSLLISHVKSPYGSLQIWTPLVLRIGFEIKIDYRCVLPIRLSILDRFFTFWAMAWHLFLITDGAGTFRWISPTLEQWQLFLRQLYNV